MYSLFCRKCKYRNATKNACKKNYAYFTQEEEILVKVYMAFHYTLQVIYALWIAVCNCIFNASITLDSIVGLLGRAFFYIC